MALMSLRVSGPRMHARMHACMHADIGSAPASFSSGRASSLMGGSGGGRYSWSTMRRSGEKDRLGSGGTSTRSMICCGGSM